MKKEYLLRMGSGENEKTEIIKKDSDNEAITMAGMRARNKGYSHWSLEKIITETIHRVSY